MSFAFISGEDQAFEEESYSVREEDARLGACQHQVSQIICLVYLTMQVDAAQLRNEELQIIPNGRVEIRVDPAFSQVLYSSLLMSIQLYQSTNWISDVEIGQLFLRWNPLLEPLNESHFRYFHSTFATAATTKQVIAGAAEPPAHSDW